MEHVMFSEPVSFLDCPSHLPSLPASSRGSAHPKPPGVLPSYNFSWRAVLWGKKAGKVIRICGGQGASLPGICSSIHLIHPSYT